MVRLLKVEHPELVEPAYFELSQEKSWGIIGGRDEEILHSVVFPWLQERLERAEYYPVTYTELEVADDEYLFTIGKGEAS